MSHRQVIDGPFACTSCGIVKPLEDFYWIASRQHYRRNCKDCENARARAWHGSNKERAAARRVAWEVANRDHRNAWRRANYYAKRKYTKRYGITKADFDQLLTAQDGRCVICGARPDVLHIDHDHATQKIRGLLCQHCNWGLGHFRDTPELLRRAADYLCPPLLEERG